MSIARIGVRLPSLSSIVPALPDELFLKIFKNLSYGDLQSVSLTCRRFYHLCNDNFLWRKFLLRDAPKHITRDFPLKSTHLKTAYRSTVHIDSNLRRRIFLQYTIPGNGASHQTFFGLGYRRVYLGYKDGTMVAWKFGKSGMAQVLDGHIRSVYFMEEIENHLFTAADDGLLQIWKLDGGDPLVWSQTKYIGEIESLTINKTGICEFSKMNGGSLWMWKRNESLFDSMFPNGSPCKKMKVTDDFLSKETADGLEVWKESSRIAKIKGEIKNFQTIGSYLFCEMEENRLEIWHYSKQTFKKIKDLRLEGAIDSLDFLKDFLCIAYKGLNSLYVYDTNFQPIRRLNVESGYAIFDDYLFIQRSGEIGYRIWERKDRGLRFMQTIVHDRFDQIILSGPFLFTMKGSSIKIWEKKDYFQIVTTLQINSPIKEISFKWGILAAHTVDGNVNVWDFAVSPLSKKS